MKKFAKMSLVAAIAVAGLTNVNAASLEEAIKGVDVSGQFRFRFQDRDGDAHNAADSANSTDVEIEVVAKVPVNDNVTAVFKIDNANDDADIAATKGGVTIEDYYFSYVNGALTVNAGQQNIPGRITDGAQGDGIVALYNMGAFTVGAAAFNNHNVFSSTTTYTVGAFNPATGFTPITEGSLQNGTNKDVYSVIAMGSFGPVSVLGQYANVLDTGDFYNVKADATVGPVMIGLEYTDSDLDSEVLPAGTGNDRSTFKAYVSGKFDIVSAKLAYATTGDDNSGSLHAQGGSWGDSVETPSEWLLWQLGTATNADMDVVALDASVAVTDKVSIRAAYADGEIGDTDVSEILGQVSYKMSSNLNTYIRVSELDTDTDEDSTRARVEVQYTF